MPKKIEEKIHILSPTRAYLAPAKVMGPIVHPLLVDKRVAVQILMNGAEVHEYIPQNKKTIKLTLANINDPKRYENVIPKVIKEAAPAVEPVKRMGVPNVKPPVEPVVETKVEEATVASEPTIEPTVEVESAITEEAPQKSIFALTFEYNEDGTVDETKIEWNKYSKNQRKEIRAQINRHNESLKS